MTEALSLLRSRYARCRAYYERDFRRLSDLLVAGTKYGGEFEHRLKAMLREIEDSQGQIVL